MAILIFSLVLIMGVFPALFFLDRLFQIDFERGSRSVFWEPKGLVDQGSTEKARKKWSLKDAVQWIFKTPAVAEDDLEAYRYLMFYRISLSFVSVAVAAALAYFLMV